MSIWLIKKKHGERNHNLNRYTFCHTLDTIPMNWYLEIEVRHRTSKWDVLKERFLLTFNFEDVFECIDESLQEMKAAIFRTPVDPITRVQPDQSMQLHHALEYYNVTT